MITRFAPSPTGPLHLGHAYSALTVWKIAAMSGGTAVLRIEDTDSTRVRPEHEARIYDDLVWLGLTWPEPVRRQSQHTTDYVAVLERLSQHGLIYPCACSRRDIIDAGAVQGADGMVYPGTCRARSMGGAANTDGIRLNISKLCDLIPDQLSYQEQGAGEIKTVPISKERLSRDIGDPILRRKDTGDIAYHLACVHDDALQNITHVVRGVDLEDLTPLHVLLQRVLGYRTPVYHHHKLIMDEAGKRLAKIDKSKALGKYRSEGASVQQIKDMIGFSD